MDNPCESPTDKSGEAGETDETAAAPGVPGATDTDGIPEETDGDGDGDLKEAAAEEGEVGRRGVDEAAVLRDCLLLTARPAPWCIPPHLGQFELIGTSSRSAVAVAGSR